MVAAGSGTRFGAPKQFLELAGIPMAGWSVRTFAEMPEVYALIVATEPVWLERMTELCAQLASARTVHVVAGGATRQQSVGNALAVVPPECDGTFVHDGARPLIAAADVRAGMQAVREGRASVLAAPIVDTVKVVSGEGRIERTIDRANLRGAQTPQFALTADLRRAHARALEAGVTATDESMLLEAIGIEVYAIEPQGENFKVTVPADARRAETVLTERRQTCG
ncbi:MAG TPA: 2-C-methyl-D-erythritol 4-phosphate cytidylyltransferase [Candidatus Tumulicola sp.]